MDQHNINKTMVNRANIGHNRWTQHVSTDLACGSGKKPSRNSLAFA